MTSPSYVYVAVIDGNTAHASDVNSLFSQIAGFLGNDTVTVDALVTSGGVTYISTDGTDLIINVPNVGGSKKFKVTIGGVHVMTIDSSGNVVFKGTVTPSGSPS